MARAIRLAAGVTQDEVAQALGITRVTVARWECAMRAPRGELRDAYVELLDRLQAEVMSWSTWPFLRSRPY